jgi:hypothetical protein
MSIAKIWQKDLPMLYATRSLLSYQKKDVVKPSGTTGLITFRTGVSVDNSGGVIVFLLINSLFLE